uniref:Uncharacterized protein n=1 Tax=Rousettus aegyptiacus TaxID=9407 RepID=A0A7J8JHF1_ROUAE|nr:hypothetical protein HJG63_010210 [Rousettus aegyptiacus]
MGSPHTWIFAVPGSAIQSPPSVHSTYGCQLLGCQRRRPCSCQISILKYFLTHMTIIKESHPSLTVFQDLSYLTADLLLLISSGVVREKKKPMSSFWFPFCHFLCVTLGKLLLGPFLNCKMGCN